MVGIHTRTGVYSKLESAVSEKIYKCLFFNIY